MKIISPTPEITFDDVLLLPDKSDFTLEQDQEKTSLSTRLTKKIKLDIPIVASPMPGLSEAAMAIAVAQMGGIAFIHPFQSFEQQLDQVKAVKQHKLKVGVAVSDLTQAGIDHVAKLMKQKVDIVCVETAHAHNKQTIEFIKKLKAKFKEIQICAALVVTGDATKDLIKAGADCIRVGIGGGSHCTTRLVTGIGRPQLSAVQECYNVAKKFDVPIMSDTGIKYAGDIPKAIAFGAETVMLGGLLTGTTECPGPIIKKNGKSYKYSWGMCTSNAILKIPFYKDLTLKRAKSITKEIIKKLLKISNFKPEIFEEGVGGLIPYKGSVKQVIKNLNDGTKRSMWYLGTKNFTQLRKKTKVIIVSDNTHLENVPRI